MISLRLEMFFNGVWNLHQNFHMVTALVLGFGIFILIWIWSPVIDKPMSEMLDLYRNFEGAKNIQDLEVLIWVFLGCYRFLTGAQHLDHDLDK